MEPTLLAGDRLLVVGGLVPRPGDVAAIRDPVLPGRTWVKRVVWRSGSELSVRGDNPGASTDSRQVGPVPLENVVGRAVYRYHPLDRAGRLPAAPSLRSKGDGLQPR
jgi:signal peptidase I